MPVPPELRPQLAGSVSPMAVGAAEAPAASSQGSGVAEGLQQLNIHDRAASNPRLTASGDGDNSSYGGGGGQALRVGVTALAEQGGTAGGGAGQACTAGSTTVAPAEELHAEHVSGSRGRSREEEEQKGQQAVRPHQPHVDKAAEQPAAGRASGSLLSSFGDGMQWGGGSSAARPNRRSLQPSPAGLGTQQSGGGRAARLPATPVPAAPAPCPAALSILGFSLSPCSPLPLTVSASTQPGSAASGTWVGSAAPAPAAQPPPAASEISPLPAAPPLPAASCTGSDASKSARVTPLWSFDEIFPPRPLPPLAPTPAATLPASPAPPPVPARLAPPLTFHDVFPPAPRHAALLPPSPAPMRIATFDDIFGPAPPSPPG